MKAGTDKEVLEDISHIVLDSDEKITVQKLANLHSKSVKDCSSLLETWVDDNVKKRKDLVVEYLVRGQLKNGKVFISVVPEQTLSSLADKTSSFHKSVYSVDVKSNSRSLDIPIYEENKVFNLTSASLGKRDIKLATALPPQKLTVKATTSKAVSVAPTAAEPKKEEQKKPVKNSISSMFAKKEASPKKEVAKKTSPDIVENGQKSKAKPAAKNSIAAFLAGKVTASKAAVPKPEATVSKLDVSAEPVKVEKTVDEQSRKRTICDDESSGDDIIPATPTPKKSPIKKSRTSKEKSKGRPTKRSRIMAVASSSESEDEEIKEERRVEKARGAVVQDSPIKKSKKAMDSDDDGVEVISSGDADKKNGDDNVENQSHVRNKAKRTVVKTYVDEAGFLVTKKEVEEYSAGEEEAPPAIKEVLKPAEKIEVANASKKKTKQGSIMNFFSKKN